MQKNDCFNGLLVTNIELTSRCDKKCWMCGRRKIDSDYPEIAMNYGDMDFNLLKTLVGQIPENTVISFHNNGEPLLYARLGEALRLFSNNIRQFDTNAKTLINKAPEIIDNLEILTISVIENDPEGDDQYYNVQDFLAMKQDRKPRLVYRLLGNVENAKRWYDLPGLVATRTLHHPLGSFKYKRPPTIPEIGICLDLLSHIVISKDGLVSPCVRFDPHRVGVIGDINKQTLAEIWNGEERKRWIRKHINGQRNELPLCNTCEFYGVPTAW